MSQCISLGDKLKSLFTLVEEETMAVTREINKISQVNTEKVLNAFINSNIGEEHLKGTTGYGYNDLGREAIERVFEKIFNVEKAFVRPQIVSGTHAITACLFGNLRPHEELLSITGKPYDTLWPILGLKGNYGGSLKDYNIKYSEVPMVNGDIDLTRVLNSITRETKMVYIQRSTGYELRPSINMDQLNQVIKEIKNYQPHVVIFIDNCYGEFVEAVEPTDVGADLIAGSLIKNPGGGLAPSGGYICGKQEYVELAAGRAVAPGIGMEMGPSLDSPRSYLQGVFMAPHVVSQALQGAVLAAGVFEKLHFPVRPSSLDRRSDIVQIIEFGCKDLLVEFCQGIQGSSPVDSRLTVEPGELPGYDGRVLMACGSFIQGSSIELSADGPMKKPYACFFQGGLSYEHVKIALYNALYRMFDGNMLDKERLSL